MIVPQILKRNNSGGVRRSSDDVWPLSFPQSHKNLALTYKERRDNLLKSLKE